jgi:hypothetical protein
LQSTAMDMQKSTRPPNHLMCIHGKSMTEACTVCQRGRTVA